MITGVHAVVFTTDADADRAFLPRRTRVSVGGRRRRLADLRVAARRAGGPSAEENGRHELYLMCDDVNATVAELSARGAEIQDRLGRGFGLLTAIRLPGGGELGLYQPKHPSPLAQSTS